MHYYSPVLDGVTDDDAETDAGVVDGVDSDVTTVGVNVVFGVDGWLWD